MPPTDPPHAPPPLADAALRRVETIRAASTVRLGKIAAYNGVANDALGAFRAKQLTYGRHWGEAWGEHARVLREGGEEAATQNLIEGVVVGAVASVVVAAGGAAFFPAAAAAKAFTAGWFSFNVGTAVVSSGAGTGAMLLIGRPSVEGPASGARDGEADAWEAIANAERSARTVAVLAPRFGLELGNAEYTIAQVNAHINNSSPDMSWDQTLQMASTLANWESGLADFDRQIDEKLAAMQTFQRAVQDWTVPSPSRLEREIWYAWMSQLSNSEVLDQDEIQAHLTRMGLLPNTWYLTDADQDRAVAAARAHVQEAASASGAPAGPR